MQWFCSDFPFDSPKFVVCTYLFAVLARSRRWASGPDADLPSEVPASQGELAMLCNVSRNTFSRVVKQLSSRRLVTLNYRSLTVNDPARLRVVADDG